MPTPTLLCLASYFKGPRFLTAAHRAGARVLLLTKDKLADAPWPRDALDDVLLMPDLHRQPDVTYGVSYLARTRTIDRIIALDEYDTLTAAALREHLRIPGMGETTARYFRDKLAMRVRAREAGLAVPAFVHILHEADIAAFVGTVPAPWVLKPRAEASAMGIQKVPHADALWPALETLGDRRSFFLLEQFVPGAVYHVDGLVWGGEVRFARASAYGKPPMDVYQGGGVFMTQTLPLEDAKATALLEQHERLVKAFGMVRGVTHAEFIEAADGTLHFLEVAARVGGANIDRMVEAASGVNLWEAWATLEVAHASGEAFHLPERQRQQAGLLVCLARQEWPDLSAYADPEVVWRLNDKAHHAGLIVAAPDGGRVTALLQGYIPRFAEDFLTVQPPLDHAPD